MLLFMSHSASFLRTHTHTHPWTVQTVAVTQEPKWRMIASVCLPSLNLCGCRVNISNILQDIAGQIKKPHLAMFTPACSYKFSPKSYDLFPLSVSLMAPSIKGCVI